MKRFLVLLALLLVPALSHAQLIAIMNEDGSTYLPSEGQTSNTFAVDRALRAIVTVSGSSGEMLDPIQVSNAAIGGIPAAAITYQVASLDVIEAGSTSTVLNLTGHLALPGDVVKFYSVSQTGTTSRQWSDVCSITANTVTLCHALSFTPSAGQEVAIARPGYVGGYTGNVSGVSSMNVNLNIDGQQSATTGILKLEDSAHVSGDALVATGAVVNTSLTSMGTAQGDYGNPTINTVGAQYVDINFSAQSSSGGGNALLKLEDSAASSGEAGVLALTVRNDTSSTPAANGDYQAISSNSLGAIEVSLNSAFQLGASGGSSPIRNEDVAFAAGNATMVAGQVRYDTPTADNADADVAPLKGNDIGAIYTDGVRRGTFTHSNPSINSGASTTLLASNANRRYFLIQNNSAANICISLNNATLTGIVPSNTNPCIVLVPTASYESPPNAVPTSAITVYQTSGGTITTVSTVEQS